jgi:hypothetical protein
MNDAAADREDRIRYEMDWNYLSREDAERRVDREIADTEAFLKAFMRAVGIQL